MYENETILIVDDQKENLDILCDMLEAFDVIPSTNGTDALHIASSEKISLILLDIVMPKPDGFDVCKILKTQEHTKHIPIIFITAKTDEKSISCAFNLGASDYISKPLKRVEVIARVKTQLALKQTIEKLEFLASRDSLTKLYNRRKFFELALPLFKETDELFLVMIDVDHFKKINDTYGHDMGDVVLKTMTHVINSMLPEGTIFARIGGEEFVAILQAPSCETVRSHFETIKNAVATTPFTQGAIHTTCTISIGIAHKNDTTKTLDDLLKQADLALYEAKDQGRNRIIIRNSR